MIEVKMDFLSLQKIFHYRLDISRRNNLIYNEDYVIVPNDKNFYHYMKFIKTYGYSTDNYNSTLDDYENKKFEDYNLLKKEKIKFFEDDYMIFEFPDDMEEEEAFYFKMKYC